MADQTFAVHCGFFDAIDSDRVYSADEMNRPYRRIISNGVFATPQGNPSTDLQVVESTGMNIICKAGEGLFGDKWFENPSGIAITVPNNTSTVPRIDSVLVQVDTRTSGRVGNIVHRTGTPASSPVPPAINQVEGVVEYRLANIRVNAGVSAITQSMITDRRGSSDCPWVTSLIYQVDTSTLYDQWAAAYAEYFEEEKAIWDAWYSQLTEDLDVSMTLDRHVNTVTTTPQTTGYIPIGLAYNHNTDILEVYINGLRAVEGTHYVVVDDTKILVENQLQIGQAVTFVVMRSVISGSATNITVLLQELESQIAGIAGGTPTVVDSTSDMTDTGKIYILSSDSKWYYYSATQEDWVIGGTYGGVPTDTTLSISGSAADAKAAGDALADKADSADVTTLDTRVTGVEDDVSNLKGDLNDSLRERTNQLFNKNDADVFAGFDMTGTVQASVGGRSVIIPVDITDQTYLTVHRTVLSARFGVATFTEYPVVGSSSVNYIVDNNAYSITIPVSSSIKYVMILVYNSSIDTTYTFDQIVDELMVQYGDAFTGYETYYIVKIVDGQITPEKLTSALKVQVEQGETDKILFGDSTNLWNTPLLEIMNNTRISGYNTSTYEITTVSAEGCVTAIMDIPENINFLRIKKSSTLPSAGQAYVLIDSTKRINNNRPFSAFSDSFKDIIVRYDSGDDYYTVNLAHARNYGFTKLGICVCNTDNMYVQTSKITSDWLVCDPDIYCPIGAFGSIGAIGDSYTAGSIVKADNSWVDMPNQSYIAVMGKRAGIPWSNYGMGGTNTRTYITNKLPDVLSATANDFYFLALGINDSSLGLDYIGSISDIHDSDYTQNADTFYGNYGKIIAQVKAHAPNARFCMVKIPIYVALRKELNAAIQEIADHYGFACIDPMDDPYFYSKTFYSRISNHPSCIGYAGMALAYERLLSKAIEKNPLYFFYSNIDANIPTVVS